MMNLSRIFFLILAVASTVSLMPSPGFALSPEEIGKNAENFTVRITGNINLGSGIIVAHQGNIYTVLTNCHVINPFGDYIITTPDGDRYRVKTESKNCHAKPIDLAVIVFSSEKNYPVATLGDATKLGNYTPLYGAGYALRQDESNEQDYKNTEGVLQRKVENEKEGATLQHNLENVEGMSGGALLDKDGQVVGINTKVQEYSKTGISQAYSIPINTYQAWLPQIPQISPTQMDKNSTEVERLISLGDKKREEKDYQGAINNYNQAIQIEPNNAYAYNNRGNAYDDLKNYQQAIADYNKAIQLDPNFAYAYGNRGYAYSELKNYEQAIADFNKAIQLDPNYAKAYISRGNAYGELENYEQAIADYNKAIQLAPNDTLAYVTRGKTYYNLKKYQQTIADFNKVIQLDPNLALAYVTRGKTYYNLKNYEQAIADYNKAIQIDPNLAYAYYNRGIAYYDLKKYQQTIADYNKVIQLNPNDANAYFLRGSVYYSLGEQQKAINDLRQAAALYKQQDDYEDYQFINKFLLFNDFLRQLGH